MATYEDVTCPLNKSKIFKYDQHFVNISKNIRTLYENQQLFDVTLFAGPERVKIQAHRFVLTTSKFFYTMFRANLHERAIVAEIELKNIEGNILKMIVDCMYTGAIEVSNDTVVGIMNAASYLGIPRLICACYNFLAEHFNVKNCIGITRDLLRYSDELYNEYFVFVCKNLERVCKEKEFLEMNSTELKELLASDDAPFASEEVVFRSLMAWIKYDKANRKDLMSSLLPAVRCYSLTPKFISDNIIPVCNSDECRKLVLKWLQWHLSPGCRTNLSNSLHAEPRRANKKAFVLSGANTSCLQIQSFDEEIDEWSCQDLPISCSIKSEFGAILRSRKLIITGGLVKKKVSRTVECLDLVTFKWTTMPPMRVARRNHAMAEVGGNLFVIGGASTNDIGIPMEMYDFTKKKWKDLSPVPLAKNDAFNIRSTATNGRLYVCSGRNLLCYNPNKNKWTHLPKGVSFTGCGLVADGEYLYLVGGYDRQNRIHLGCAKRLNLLTGKSQELGSLESNRSNMSCFALNGVIVVCGGYCKDGISLDVDMFYPHTDSWNFSEPMLHGNNLYIRNSL